MSRQPSIWPRCWASSSYTCMKSGTLASGRVGDLLGSVGVVRELGASIGEIVTQLPDHAGHALEGIVHEVQEVLLGDHIVNASVGASMLP